MTILVIATPTHISDDGINKVLVSVDADLPVLEGNGHASEATWVVVNKPHGRNGRRETEAPQTLALRVGAGCRQALYVSEA